MKFKDSVRFEIASSVVQLPDYKHTRKSERFFGSFVNLNVFALLVRVAITRNFSISDIGRLNDIVRQVLAPSREKVRGQCTLTRSATGFSHRVRNCSLNLFFSVYLWFYLPQRVERVH